MPAVLYPRSSTPGARVGEGEGRLINAFWEKVGDSFICRRVPGVAGLVNMGLSIPRGFIDVNGVIYGAFNGQVATSASGPLSGAFAGTDGVTWARNNRSGGPDVVLVREGSGAGVVTTSTAGYPDADLPATVNSVSFLNGYLLFTVPDGRIFASGLNTTAIDPLSFGVAESSPDGLKRGIVHGSKFYAMGTSTIEPWLDQGLSPFPLERAASVIPVGLLTTMAVTGTEEGWDHNPYLIAHDATVRELAGFTANKIISTPPVERFIAVSDVTTIEMFCYTVRGRPMVVISSDQGTWEANIAAEPPQWNERQSLGGRWRASKSVKSGGVWHLGDRSSTFTLGVSEANRSDGADLLTWTVESAPMKDYPLREIIPAAFFEFTTSTSSVDISYSLDGGATWSTPVTRSLSGADKEPIRVNRLGLSTQHGIRFRLAVNGTGDFSFLGASVPDVEARAA